MKKNLVLALAVVAAAFVCLPGSVHAAPCPYEIEASTVTVDFGAVNLASTETDIVTINNNTDTGGYCDAGITFTITGDDSDNFSYAADASCTTVAEGSSCTVEVSFTPDIDGEFNATLNVIVSTTTRDTVALTGTGYVSNDSDSDDSSGCDANASTGVAGKKAFGPAAIGLFAMLGLVMGTAAIRRRMR